MDDESSAHATEDTVREYASLLGQWRLQALTQSKWDVQQLDVGSDLLVTAQQYAAALRPFCRCLAIGNNSGSDLAESAAIQWSLIDSDSIAWLKAAHVPLATEKVVVLVKKLGLYLAALHEHGLHCRDISPSLCFFSKSHGEVVVVPTIAAGVTEATAQRDGTYIAPELRGDAETSSSTAGADIYGLGQLAWTLLTGQCGRNPSFALPSDADASLSDWDEFIDATCRTHPERRPTSMQQALGMLPKSHSAPAKSSYRTPVSPNHDHLAKAPADRTTQTTEAPGFPQPRSRGLLTSRRAVLGGGLIAATLGVYRWTAKKGGPLRGFADTIIRYPDRSYEGASWKRVHSAESIRGVMPKQSCNNLDFSLLAGYDDDNLWVQCDRDNTSVFLQLINGHWEYRQTVGEQPSWPHSDLLVQRPHLLTPTRFVPCVNYALYEVTASAIRKINSNSGETKKLHHDGASGVAVITEDYYFHTTGDGSWYDGCVVSNGKATLLDDGTKKEAFVYSSEFNAPLENYRVKSIGFPATYRRGYCLGLCIDKNLAKIVEFRDGKWWDRCDVKLTDRNAKAALEPRYVRDVYFGTYDGHAPGFAILCGPTGTVIFKDLSGVEEERSVVPRQESTTAELIRAWGFGPEKYWVMDAKGEVWERNNGQSRVVVRGLHDSDLMDSDRGFHTAWVSITGNVFAATKKYLFKLS